ncbi:hypothetical protein IT399_00810 [Candidatus Nomurabacteria bacterium]|nr:hypothetical protein [Candidatus Nomurabacteria bacterium]
MNETFFLAVILAIAVSFLLRIVLGGKKTMDMPTKWAPIPNPPETEEEKKRKEVKKLFELADDIANYFGCVLSSKFYGSPWGYVHTSRYEVVVGGNKFALYHNMGKRICLLATGGEVELGEQELLDSGVIGPLVEALEKELAVLTEDRDKERKEEERREERKKEEEERRRATCALLRKTFL